MKVYGSDCGLHDQLMTATLMPYSLVHRPFQNNHSWARGGRVWWNWVRFGKCCHNHGRANQIAILCILFCKFASVRRLGIEEVSVTISTTTLQLGYSQLKDKTNGMRWWRSLSWQRSTSLSCSLLTSYVHSIPLCHNFMHLAQSPDPSSPHLLLLAPK